jgi:putrescine transport system permease protein
MNRTRTLALAVPWAWLVLFVLLPAAIVLKIALAAPADSVPPYTSLLQWHGAMPWLALHWDSFALVLSDPFYRHALLYSVRVAGVSTAICLLAGYPVALALARAPAGRRNVLLFALMLPFWTGFLMRINAWIGLLQDDGWINAALVFLQLSPVRLLYSDTALYIGMVYTYLPFMVLPLYARLTRLDPALLEAAGDLGAPPWRAFLSVTLPLSMPGVWAGALLVFIPAVGEYVIPELLGGPRAQLVGRVLADEFLSADPDWPATAALACVLLAALLILPGVGLHVAGRLQRRGSSLAEPARAGRLFP